MDFLEIVIALLDSLSGDENLDLSTYADSIQGVRDGVESHRTQLDERDAESASKDEVIGKLKDNIAGLSARLTTKDDGEPEDEPEDEDVIVDESLDTTISKLFKEEDE